MKLPTHEDFINYVRNHLENSGEKPSNFGKRVLGDSASIHRLLKENGTDPRLSTMTRIVNDIEAYEAGDVNSY